MSESKIPLNSLQYELKMYDPDFSYSERLAELYREQSDEYARHRQANRDIRSVFLGFPKSMLDEYKLGIASFCCAKPVVTREAFIK